MPERLSAARANFGSTRGLGGMGGGGGKLGFRASNALASI